MHAMKWRFIPVGDSFLEAFMSRDSDSMVTQRELSSVNVWLNSSMAGYIMKGNPSHLLKEYFQLKSSQNSILYHPFHDVVGGMWGFYNTRNQLLAKQIYSLVTDKQIASHYNKVVNQKGQDQVFLADRVYPLIRTSFIYSEFLFIFVK